MTADALTQEGQPNVAQRNATEALKVSIKLGDMAAESSAMRAQAEAVAGSHRKAVPYFKRRCR